MTTLYLLVVTIYYIRPIIIWSSFLYILHIAVQAWPHTFRSYIYSTVLTKYKPASKNNPTIFPLIQFQIEHCIDFNVMLHWNILSHYSSNLQYNMKISHSKSIIYRQTLAYILSEISDHSEGHKVDDLLAYLSYMNVHRLYRLFNTFSVT